MRAFRTACSHFVLSSLSNPVTAEDGRIYEESAKKKHFNTKPGYVKVDSPTTRQPMGKKLFSSPMIKSYLETMIIENGAQGDLANKWREDFEEKKRSEELIHRAQNQCRLSMDQMRDVGKWCLDGNPDLYIKKNLSLAFRMFERLRAANDPDGTAYFGRMLYRGEGPIQNIQIGLVSLGVAAGQGSTIAAVYLGECFGDPEEDMAEDFEVEEAIRWTRLSLLRNQHEKNPNHKLSDYHVASIRKKLADHQDFKYDCLDLPNPATEEIVVVE